VDEGIRLDGDAGLGQRIAAARRRRGLSRRAAAELCGRSEEWLRKVERGQRGTSLRTAARLAEVLRTPLAELLGEQTSPSVYVRPEHEALGQVRAALVAVPPPAKVEPVEALATLRSDVAAAWRLRSVSGRDRSDLAAVLPRLLTGTAQVVRSAEPEQRREARRLAAEVHHLAQLYLCYQDAAELLWVAVDRAAASAVDADDPLAIARAAWFSAYLFRDTGHVEQAHQVVDDALRELDRSSAVGTPAARRQRANVALAAALNHARDGAHADAWRWWDVAVAADREAVAGGVPLSPHALFGQDVSDVALSLDVELGRSASALRRAEATDTDAVASVPRRARLLLEVARGHLLRREHTAAVALLQAALDTGPEATIYSLHGRSMVLELQATAGPMLRSRVGRLAERMSISN
jgi:transcriptional regulator with XRE-family HTH domain